MRRAEIALFCAACAASVPAFAQNYGSADTFVPGKKYTCVPTPDHKGWDCNESGKSVQIKPAGNETPRPAAPPKTETVAPTPVASAPSEPSRSTLPSYLTSAAASSPARTEEAPSTVSAAAAHANAPSPVPTPTIPLSAPTETPAPSTRTVPLQPATTSAIAATPAPSRPVAKPVALRATHSPVAEASSGSGEFMSLAGDRFVVEVAHATNQRELDATRSATHVPSGELYEVHLRQNGADAWLLLWGSFDSLEAARSARNTMSASATIGWPRRVAPLQAEARRVSP